MTGVTLDLLPRQVEELHGYEAGPLVRLRRPDNLIRRGFLERVAPKMYALTPLGRAALDRAKPELELADEPRRDEADRYALYVVDPKAPLTEHARKGMNPCRRRVYETCLEGIGQGIRMLYDEEEVPRGWRIGVLDRLERFWLVNPYA